MVAELAALAVAIFAVGAELLHARRCAHVAALAYGPAKRPAIWAQAAPVLRVAALAAMTWGMVTLILLTPKIHKAVVVAEGDYRHIMMVLDVSPSMRLTDSGPDKIQSRMQRARDVMDSFFKRVPIEQYRMSVVAVYNEAIPVVIDTVDIEVVRNILGDLPMHYAFKSGKTDLFSGLKQASELCRPWRPDSATMLVISDGDTIPATGMPRMPASIRDVVVIGVGDPKTGGFINGRHSRQDVSTLRQMAVRLGGTYHNGNERHLSSDLLKQLTTHSEKSPFEQLGKREYALAAVSLGGLTYAFLPMLLYYFGTRWRPGVPIDKTAKRGSRGQKPGRGNQSRETVPTMIN
jgi:Ca-activated chloride channel family protein